MLEQYFLRPTTVDRIRSNWLAPQIEQYVEWMHAHKYAGRNITRRIAVLCHFADFTRTNGATDLASSSSLVERFGDHWIAGNRCWNLETRPKLRRDICSIVRQMLRLILEGRVIRERGRPPFQFQSEAPRFFQLSLPKTHRATREPPEVIQSHFGTIRTASVLPQETTVRSANGQTARSAFSGERSQAGFDQAALRV